jgi:NADH:ubiquinone oxidoreductase subunit E
MEISRKSIDNRNQYSRKKREHALNKKSRNLRESLLELLESIEKQRSSLNDKDT